MKKELRNNFGKLYFMGEFDPENKWVKNTWIGYQSIDNVINGANACLEILEANNCSLLLNDNSKVVGPWDQTTDWIGKDWAPRAQAIGLTHFAHVASPESYAALSAELMASKIEGLFEIRVFETLKVAEEWLLRVSKK